MLHRLTIFVLCCLFFASAQAQQKTTPFEKEIDAFIEKGMVDWNAVGLSVAIVKDDDVVYLKGFGKRTIAAEGKVDPDTRFGIMSTTKAMTALCVAMLVDEKKLQWDDPVTKYLPWFRMPDQYVTEQITVRDLLRHNTGLPSADFLWMRGELTDREIFEHLRYLKPAYSFRDGFEYQNVMYGLAGLLVEQVSGIPWRTFVETRIMKELGMARSTATFPRSVLAKDQNISQPHFEINGVLKTIPEDIMETVQAAGTAWSTARDMALWVRFLLAGGVANGKRLVSKEAFAELFKPQALVAQDNFYPTTALTKPHWTNYGLGWFEQDYRGHFVAMHTGSLDGRIALVGLLPDEHLGFVIFGNNDHLEFRHALMWKIFDLFTGAPARDWNGETLKLYSEQKAKSEDAKRQTEKKRVLGTKPSKELKAYAGTYENKGWGSLVIDYKNAKLGVRIGTNKDMQGQLEHWHYDTFRTKLGDGRNGWNILQFALAADGSVASVTLDENADYTFERPKKIPAN